eukprot:UN03004
MRVAQTDNWVLDGSGAFSLTNGGFHFFVDQVLLVKNFAMYDASGKSKYEQRESEKNETTTESGSVDVAYSGWFSSVEASVSFDNSSTKKEKSSELKMSFDEEFNTQNQPGIVVGWLLLKPMLPCPLLSGIGCVEPKEDTCNWKLGAEAKRKKMH